MPGFVLVDQAVRDRYLEEFLVCRAELAVFHTKCEGHDREDDHRRKYHHEYSRWRHHGGERYCSDDYDHDEWTY